jgi:sugar phosphate isomerase/epimerase
MEMKVGVADYGMNVYEGGCYSLRDRLEKLKAIGYEGLERLEASNASQALQKASIFHTLGMDFATVRTSDTETAMQWTIAFGKQYVWLPSVSSDFDRFCRQSRIFTACAAQYGLKAVLHNHLGTVVESQEQLDEFMTACPECGLLLDTAHLAAAGGDPLKTIRTYPERIVSMHLKDWITLNPQTDLSKWTERGRFCELGAGNIGLDNAKIIRELRAIGYDGWLLVEQDTHLRDPYEDLAVSRDFLRRAGV